MFWLFNNLHFRDFIDIFLLSYVLYRALLILKGTRAVQSLLGLLFLVLIYAFAQEMELHSLHWVLDKFFVYLVLAVIILFQEDIRKGLARAGRLFPSLNSDRKNPTFQGLIKVSFALSSRRIGALIAIERNATLEEYVEPATQMDALITPELLTAIFLPTSPLHDGAVIIRNNRVAAAQCFLPLAITKDISRIYGTRHLAAIGLTEATDALVVVISEERGTVAIARYGQLEVVHDANEMRQRLQEYMTENLDSEEGEV
jgi:diadenylate cyclase